MAGIVVIGAGQAGASLVARLRANGHDGPITLIGEEPHLPYQRPPLSKDYLLGKTTAERLTLRNDSYYAEHRIDLHIGQRVTAIDRDARRIQLGDDSLGYAQLALTTGSVPRRLPAAIGGGLDGVHVVRTLADVNAMSADFAGGGHVLIVGGGYIGLEAAAVSAQRGLRVTLIEMTSRILQRVAAPDLSDYFRALHQSHGVEILEGAGLDRLTGEGRVVGAVLSDGRSLAVDFVIVGIGIVPATALAAAAGLDIDNGIAVDRLGRTSDPAIWAAGDCTSFPHDGGRIRLESVQNAIDQAECVADNIMGADSGYRPLPWFWSDQYDARLQIAGLSTGHDRIVRRPGPDAAARPNAGQAAPVSFWYYRGDRLLAVDAINDSRAYLVGKRLLDMGRSPDPATLAAPGTDLKALLK